MKKDYRTGILDIHWSLRLIVMVPVCVCVNWLFSSLVNQSAVVPLWLEQVGTFLSAYFGGPLYAILTGVVSQLVLYHANGWLYTALCTFGISGCAIAMGITVRLGLIQSWKKATAAGVLIGLISAMMEFPVAMAISGGGFGSNYPLNYLYIRLSHLDILPGLLPLINLGCRILAEIPDKLLTVWIVYGIIRLAPDFWNKYFRVEKPVPIEMIKKKEKKE